MQQNHNRRTILLRRLFNTKKTHQAIIFLTKQIPLMKTARAAAIPTPRNTGD